MDKQMYSSSAIVRGWKFREFVDMYHNIASISEELVRHDSNKVKNARIRKIGC